MHNLPRYSLVRKCVERSGLGWDDACPFDLPPDSSLGRIQQDGRNALFERKSERLGLGEALLTPTRLYVTALLPLLKQGLLKGTC